MIIGKLNTNPDFLFSFEDLVPIKKNSSLV